MLALLQETCRATLRRAYHEWSAKKMTAGQAWTWDGFIRDMVEEYKRQEEMEEEMEKAEEKRIKMMEGLGKGVSSQQPAKPMDCEEESEDQPEKEDKHPEVPEYKDGMLKKSFSNDHWELFRECSACQRWSYINKGNELRMNPGCKGCQAPQDVRATGEVERSGC
eukprot:s6005_g1.t1